MVNHRFLERLNREKPTTMNRLADIWYEGNGSSWENRNAHYNSSRYHMLNLHATFTKGTIEFRLFQFADPADGKRNGLHAGYSGNKYIPILNLRNPLSASLLQIIGIFSV